MSTQQLTLVFADGKRLHVRGAEGVPREGDHALALGRYYRVEAVVWQFGQEVQNGDLTVPAMSTEIHLRPVAPEWIDAGPTPSPREAGLSR